MRALVTGASIAGPAAACWLSRTGWSVTVVEAAPELRRGGQNIDVRATGREVLRQRASKPGGSYGGPGRGCFLRVRGFEARALGPSRLNQRWWLRRGRNERGLVVEV